jgi:hypothetical protein
MEYEIEEGNGFLECKFPEYPVIPKKDAYFTQKEFDQEVIKDLKRLALDYHDIDIRCNRGDMWDDFDGYEDFDPRK